MTFSIICPNDGNIDVGLEDIESIIVRDEDSVEVLFKCPRCGGEISVSAQVPRVLLSALEDVWSPVEENEGDERHLRFTAVVADLHGDVTTQEPETSAQDAERIERYVEYFHRQLESAESADAVIAEIDGR